MLMNYSCACEGEKNHTFVELVSINIIGESVGKLVFGSPLFISIENSLYSLLVDRVCFDSAGILSEERVGIGEHVAIIK